MCSASRDLTARATIRNEALVLFAQHGPDAVSLRQIAAAAGVSPALVVHHFGGKDGLRAAVDDYARGVFDDLLDADADQLATLRAGQGESIATAIGAALPPDSPLPAYLRRLLLAGDPVGAGLFRRWHAATLRLLTTLNAQDLLAPHQDTALRAAVLLVNDLAMILLREQISDVLGIDPLAPDGLRRWADEVSALYATGLWRDPHHPQETP